MDNKIGKALVVGAGISGIRAAIDLAQSGYQVILCDRAPNAGGILSQLDYQFPTNRCGMCRMLPMAGRDEGLQTCLRKGLFHENIDLRLGTTLVSVEGEPGKFQVCLNQAKAAVDPSRCIGCGLCTDACPVVVNDAFNANLTQRKAIYLPVPHNIPNTYTIDPDACTGCGECEPVCPTNAIDLSAMGGKDFSIQTADEEAGEESDYLQETVGAIVLATGTAGFDPASGTNPMGYGVVPNVVTSIEFERMVSGTGPTPGNLLRPSDGTPVKRAAWIQCVGSRNFSDNADYCSTICCMFALKEAALARRMVGDDFQATILYMDLRTFGKSFERYGKQVASSPGVRLVRGRVHSIVPTHGSDDVTMRWTTADGQIHTEAFDLVVLSVGQRPHEQTATLAKDLGIDTDPFGFIHPLPFSGTCTKQEGIFAGGTLTGPTDIAESVIRASSAALRASITIHRAGGDLVETKIQSKNFRDVDQAPPAILVAVCRCNAQSQTNEPSDRWLEELKSDPAVATVVEVEGLCTEQGLKTLAHRVTGDINRVLVGACRPLIYRGKKKALSADLALDPAYIEMVEMVDAGQQGPSARLCAFRAGISRLKNATATADQKSTITDAVLVVGGGIAGMTAALAVADHGMDVTLVETTQQLGGNLTWIDETIDGDRVGPFLRETVDRIHGHPKIQTMLESRVVGGFGQAGNFFTTIETEAGPTTTMAHGAVILATGGTEATTDAYGHGTSDAVVTQKELAMRIREERLSVDQVESVAMILCVGSRQEPRNYCSRVCCPTALKQALWLKEKRPEIQVYILYRDMMTCGQTERWFTEARRRGILFFQYRPDAPPRVDIGSAEKKPVTIGLFDPILNGPVEIGADLLVLATGIVPNLPESLMNGYGLARDADGFFMEADSKWRPVESMTAGVYSCGLALSPRSIPETVATAEAAAGRALSLLSAQRLPKARNTALVRHGLCTLCLRCVDTCPYNARFLDEEGRRVEVNPLMCQGCGDCATVCPNGASLMEGFSHRGMFGAIEGAVM